MYRKDTAVKKIKKLLLILLSIAIIFSLSACSNDKTKTDDGIGYNNVGDFQSGISVAYPDDIKSCEKLPLIVWGNGTGCNPKIYDDLIESFVDAGYIVVVNEDCYGEDGVAEQNALNTVLEISKDSSKDNVLYNKIDEDKIVACGHSLGGKKSVNLANIDSRVKAVASIAGNSEIYETAKLTVPVLFFGADDDTVVTVDEYVRPAFLNCNSPCVYASFKSGGHALAISDYESYSNYIINWFNAFLYDDEEANSKFVPDGEFAHSSDWSVYETKNF